MSFLDSLVSNTNVHVSNGRKSRVSGTFFGAWNKIWEVGEKKNSNNEQRERAGGRGGKWKRVKDTTHDNGGGSGGGGGGGGGRDWPAVSWLSLILLRINDFDIRSDDDEEQVD